MPVSHYENFPVASLLLPRPLRAAVEAIYWFARSADDIADEGVQEDGWRLDSLDRYRCRLDDIEAGRPLADDARWESLARHIHHHSLPIAAFRDLIDAFAQDVTTKRYPTFSELADYCRRSANPVGRLLLHLFGQRTERALMLSDRICTALQLLNFCQDAAVDWEKGRIYFPQDEMSAAGVGESHLARQCADAAWQALFAQQLERATALLEAGSELPHLLRGRPRLELKAIITGGRRIGLRLAATQGDVFRRRPRLTTADAVAIAASTLRPWPVRSLTAPLADPST
jgi:squalene synthase HpnC